MISEFTAKNLSKQIMEIERKQARLEHRKTEILKRLGDYEAQTPCPSKESHSSTFETEAPKGLDYVFSMWDSKLSSYEPLVLLDLINDLAGCCDDPNKVAVNYTVSRCKEMDVQIGISLKGLQYSESNVSYFESLGARVIQTGFQVVPGS